MTVAGFVGAGATVAVLRLVLVAVGAVAAPDSGSSGGVGGASSSSKRINSRQYVHAMPIESRLPYMMELEIGCWYHDRFCRAATGFFLTVTRFILIPTTFECGCREGCFCRRRTRACTRA